LKGLLFTFGMTFGGAVVSLFQPWYGLLIYVSFSILRPEFLWFWSVPMGNYSRIIAIALLIGWAIHGCGDWNFRGARSVVVILLLYFGWQVVRTVLADVPDVAWHQVEIQAKIFVPVVVGLTLIRSIEQLMQLAWVMALSMGYVAYEATMAYWAGNNWLRETGFGTMDNNSISIGMVAMAGLAFFLAVGETVWYRKLIAFAAALFLIHAPMVADSRGGLLALVISAPVAFVLLPKRPQYYLIFALTIAIGVRLAGPMVVERFASIFAEDAERDPSAQSRLDLWEDCWDLMKKRPLGVGPDHWPLYAPQYGWPRGKECHSLWFNTGAELGFPGLGLLILFYLVPSVKLWFLQRRSWCVEPQLVAVARMVIASIAGFAVAASFVSLDNLEPPYYVVLLGAGALKIAPLYEPDPWDDDEDFEDDEDYEPEEAEEVVCA
jgi:probable O-glycosylation ligase (exosortase A-associated)